MKTADVINYREIAMTKIDRTRIVKAAIGSARLEGYKDSLKEKPAKKNQLSRVKSEAKTLTKR